MKTKKVKTLIPSERIERSILIFRDQKVMIDADLAELYGVDTRTLIQAVRRNISRFPDDFMFQLTDQELKTLRSQFAISKDGKSREVQEVTNLRSQIVISKMRGGRRYNPYVFTEQGVAMLSSVLNSPRAVSVNVEIMRAFVRLRTMVLSHTELSRKLNALENKYDTQFRVVFDAIRELMIPPEPKRKRIGFGN